LGPSQGFSVTARELGGRHVANTSTQSGTGNWQVIRQWKGRVRYRRSSLHNHPLEQ